MMGLNKFRNNEKKRKGFSVILNQQIPSFNSYVNEGRFCFLNVSHEFKDDIDWSFMGHGLLWNYNLNYFDFLQQESMIGDIGISLITDFIRDDHSNAFGFDPYPTSLRIINWVKFLSRFDIDDAMVSNHLYAQQKHLRSNLEFHLMANHYLENGFALLFAAIYFRDKDIFGAANKILIPELKEQILDDGAHFELSTMYHCIILHRLLDSVDLLKNVNEGMPFDVNELLDFLSSASAKMCGWIVQITKGLHKMPLFGDAAHGITHNPVQLIKMASDLGIEYIEQPLGASGYRRIDHGLFSLVADIGSIKPSYQPGHAHADELSYVLFYDGRPFIVDTGTSTYESGEIRSYERSTSAHNTINIDGENSSAVWSAFRVAKRANVYCDMDRSDYISVYHDGYSRTHNTMVKRIFEKKSDGSFEILDAHSLDDDRACQAVIHFHPNEEIIFNNYNTIETENVTISFEGFQKIEIAKFDYALMWNKRTVSKKAIVHFERRLRTKIYEKK